MSLYYELVNMPLEKVHYYNTMPVNNAIKNITHKSAYDYINKYYEYGKKGSVFDVGFSDKFYEDGKHIHTVVLYYLGCLFSDLVDSKLKSHIQTFVQTDEWYDFRYTWFLTCLYHDTAAVIEKEDWVSGCSSDLNFYLNKHKIQHNVFEHNWQNNYMKPYTYPESLVKNYFKYRVQHCHSIDHGIIAGYLLYDRLIKNYNMAWKEASNGKPYVSYEDFYHNNLSWRIEHIHHFAIIADAIIAHNIWLSDDATLYKQFDLDPLIITPKNKLTITKNLLTFFLGLFDTIEPVKHYGDPSCLNNISMEIKGQCIEITFVDDVGDDNKAIVWIEKIEGIKNWLYVEIKEKHSCKIIIRIK